MTETHPVGSVFRHKKHGLLQVVESLSCDDCVFNDKVQYIGLCCLADDSVDLCSYRQREDKKSVIFKQYKKNG